MTSSVSKLFRSRDLSVVLAVVSLIIGGEFFFRHYFLFWLPIFGTLAVNDMLSLFLGYLLLSVSLGVVMHINWQQELADFMQSFNSAYLPDRCTGILS